MRDEQRRNILLDWLDEQVRLASAQMGDRDELDKAQEAADRYLVLIALRRTLKEQVED